MPRENKWTDLAWSAIVDEDPSKLEGQICFNLYVCSKEIIKKYKPLLDPYDLTYTSYITLAALWEKDGVGIKDLGKRLYLDSGTLTPVLKKLETLGYVERSRLPEDERNMVVVLTQRGKDLEKELEDVPRKAVADTSFSGVRSLVLSQALSQLRDTLDQKEKKND